MHKTRKAQQTGRYALLFPKPEPSTGKIGLKTSMGPPPPQTSTRRPLQDSARQNTNLYRPFKTVTPAPQPDKKTLHTDSALKEISLASILKRSGNFDSANESARESGRQSARKEEFLPRCKRRKVQIANPLYEEYKDCMDSCRETLESSGRTALNEAFEDLTTYVKELVLEKEGQMETIRNQLTSVLAPVDRVTTPGGRMVNVAKEIEAFGKMVEEEEKLLNDKWGEWEQIQMEISYIGIQVLGNEENVVEDEVYRSQSGHYGYKSEMEKWMKELEEELKGPLEEIKQVGEEALKKLAQAEKESEDKFRQQKAKIVAAITMDDD